MWFGGGLGWFGGGLGWFGGGLEWFGVFQWTVTYVDNIGDYLPRSQKVKAYPLFL